MDKLRINGGRTLQGEVTISGAKNAALPELCAALLTAEPVTLTNVPRLQDVSTMLKLVRNMGVAAERDEYAPRRGHAGAPMSSGGWCRRGGVADFGAAQCGMRA